MDGCSNANNECYLKQLKLIGWALIEGEGAYQTQLSNHPLREKWGPFLYLRSDKTPEHVERKTCWKGYSYPPDNPFAFPAQLCDLPVSRQATVQLFHWEGYVTMFTEEQQPGHAKEHMHIVYTVF